ncbi:putative pentatricopeptide repeat-containing protein At3g13770, mitochondrial [Magnolia sinica]|uniref:putative pentatricopeptide repeat-containing protein At3g13770, mitochondrial n=1 Tax=Magnolia sinica TaxID=86752 RepID=UPI00265AB3EE|nr:putative pentatricopeptide repeat-containing protein At3g13770, mitochondrial [Magnolia sinica]
MYSKSGQIHHARKVFDEIPHRNIFSFNAMLIAYSSHDQHSEALRLFSSLASFKPALKPDSFTISSLLKALSLVPLPHPILGKEIHASVLRHGFDSDLFVTNAVVTFYQCSCMGIVSGGLGKGLYWSRRERAEKDLLELQVVQLNVRKLEDELMSWKLMLKEIPDVSCSDDIPRKFASLQKELIDSMIKLGEISAHLKQLEVALESADLAKQHAETEAALAKEKAEESLLVVKRLELMVWAIVNLKIFLVSEFIIAIQLIALVQPRHGITQDMLTTAASVFLDFEIPRCLDAFIVINPLSLKGMILGYVD